MSFIPDTPENRDVELPTTVSKALNDWRIVKVIVNPGPDESVSGAQATVIYAVGYVDTGTFHEVERKTVTLSGAQFETDLGAMADPAKDKLNNLLDGIWTVLQSLGSVPAGTIT